MARTLMTLKREEVVVIEDSMSGIVAARRAGINVFAINRGGSLNGIDTTTDQSIVERSPDITNEESFLVKNSRTIPIKTLFEVIDLMS